MADEPVDPTAVFKALSDPMRWKIIQQLAAEQGEYACSLLEAEVPVSKPTISYHIKLLAQAGLIKTHKRGRRYYYVLQRNVLQEVFGTLQQLTSPPGALDATAPSSAAAPSIGSEVSTRSQSVLLTW